MASLQHLVNGNYQHMCGATIINKDWILTAAHCVKEINNVSDLKLIFGTNRLNFGSRTERSVRIRFENILSTYFYIHSSEIRGLCLMKWPCEMLQKLPYFWNMKTHADYFSFCATLFFPNEFPGLWKMKNYTSFCIPKIWKSYFAKYFHGA